MKWIDVSVPLSEDHPAWPTDDPFRYWETRTIADGGKANCASMSLSLHYGTHVDAPYHFIPGGKTIDEVEADLFIGPCLVISVLEADAVIEPVHLEGKVPQGTKRLLVKTQNSFFVRDKEFHTDYTAFSEKSAQWLVDRGVRLLGLDYFSIGPYDNNAPPHRAFLTSGGIALETIDLSSVEPGEYEICCLPLKVKGSGGAPARVLLGKR